jgi:hypothetical protein
MWQMIAGLGLDMIKKNEQQEDLQAQNKKQQQLDLGNLIGAKKMQRQQMVNDFDAGMLAQRGAGTQQQVFDDIMKKYKIGRL